MVAATCWMTRWMFIGARRGFGGAPSVSRSSTNADEAVDLAA
jgi:hypothetical protein